MTFRPSTELAAFPFFRFRSPAVAAITLLPLILAGGMACAGEGSGVEGRGVTIRVEDGVTIVENGGLHLADSTAWRIDTAAVARIGMLEGPEEYVFGEVSGLVLRSDGTIVVGDGQARELRLYDLEGTFLRSVGGGGEGPGEFGGITKVEPLAGDSLAVISSQRIDLLDADLAFIRRVQARLPREEMSVEPPFSSDRLEGVFADGRPLMGDYVGVCDRDDEDVCADSIGFKRTDETGTVDVRFGRFVYARQLRQNPAPDLPGIVMRDPFPQAYWAVSRDRFYYADAERFEILVFRSDGTLERRIRVDHSPRSYTREEVWPPDAAPIETAGDPRMERLSRAFREFRATVDLPGTFPAFSDLLVDATGHIWVREYVPAAPEDEGPPRWFVFDPEGRLRYAVPSVPGMVRRTGPLADAPPVITDEYVIVRVEDELDVESVVVYGLVKGR